ncbi:amidase [Williamsia sp.]|uniref:amidase n=1 Tax=Williamsia sp. TaxID=1872085 RepID=UPI002F934671
MNAQCSDLDATAVLSAFEAGEATARSVMDAALACIEADASQVNSVIRLNPSATREADDVDRRRRAGERLPPLAGLPITIKDAFDVEGMISGHGCVDEEHLAVADAPSVLSLRKSGAIIVGKTNVPTRLADWQSSSPHFGHSRNPWDPGRTSGGSSSGAAAVACGQSYVDLGSDMSGSVRVPASWCGTYALRPSHGIISKRGHLPWPPELRLEPPASTVGLTTRSARDLSIVFEALAGDARGTGHLATRAQAPETSPATLRFGVWLPTAWPQLSGTVRAVIEAFVDRVTASGYPVRPVEPPRSTSAEVGLYQRLTAAEIAHGGGDTTPTEPLLALLEDQADVAARWDHEIFGQVDILIAPATPIVAPHLSDVPQSQRSIDLDGVARPASELLTWSVITSVAQCPSVVVPAGPESVTGLPVGVQLMARRGHDRTAMSAAIALEDLGVTRFAAPPTYTQLLPTRSPA